MTKYLPPQNVPFKICLDRKFFIFILCPSDLPQLAGPSPSAAISGPTNVRHRVRGDRAHLQCQRGGTAEGKGDNTLFPK